MICIRCGYCCQHYSVMIVDDPEKGIMDGNIIHHKGDGPCKHLIGNKVGEYSCAIHDKPWYSETPCYNHTQIGKENAVCRMGEFILKKAI